MPVKSRALCPSWHCLACAFALCAALVAGAAVPARAASALAVSQNDGYSGHVMDKVLAVWSPPATSEDRQLRLCVSLDGEGRVTECKAVRPSGLSALDASGCAAVREAAPFGTPPYGMPLDVYFSFWTGRPKGKSADTAAAAIAPAQAPAQAQAPADSHAQAAALAAATATGAATATAAASRPAAASSSAKAQDKYDSRFQKYISTVVWKLRNSMYIPAQTKPGTYHATAQVRLNSAGKILDESILKGSGDALLDKYVLQGIRRAGSVAPPPAGLGDTLDLTFTLTRQ
ncbi:TonB family protein [Desulfovibrio sp.]|uniref:TonB family protein n=1 Tax=Desulfovibrio sp. TaxID=885 RepID=UPI0023CDF3CD|nr:TonB family protein [Desulfovibrio sp.]MDE7241516.1 TonB C-terminal domain-containing protein [Desulfovibrio sp.]